MSKFSVSAFMSVLPDFIAKDEHLAQLAEVAARVMAKSMENIWKPALYSRIDDMDEGALDILAEDLNVYWYDYNYDLATKRNVIKANFSVHQHMASKGAMITALSAVWADSNVEEWYEYGGDPYHFRVLLDISESSDPVELEKIRSTIMQYKNARSWLDGIYYTSQDSIAEIEAESQDVGISIDVDSEMY